MSERSPSSGSNTETERRTFLSGIGAGVAGAGVLSAGPGVVTGTDSTGSQASTDGGAPRAATSSHRGGLSIGGGSLGYATAQSTPSLNLSEGLQATFEFWVKHDGTSDTDAIILEKNESGSNGYQVSFDGDGEEPAIYFGFVYPNSANWSVTSNSGIPAETWTHVACVYDGNQQAIYIDGELDNTRTDWNDERMTGNDVPLALGANSAGNDRFFSGEVDEVRIWNTARSLLEIRGTRLEELTGDEDRLAAYYQFDGGSTDDAARSNDLSLTGSVSVTQPGALPAPPKLYARAGDGTVELRWQERVGPSGQNAASTFRLYRSTTADGGDRSKIGEYGSDTTATTVSAVNDQAAYYWLTAVDGDGNETDFSYPAITYPSTQPFGRGLTFPGSNSRVTVDDRPRLDMPNSTQTTIEFWVKHDGESDEEAILVGKNESDSNGYLVNFTGNSVEPNVEFGMKWPNSVNWTLVSESGIPQDEWTHIACVYDGSKQVIYIDGELDATREDWNGSTMNGNDAPFRLGAADQTGQRLFSGQLDDIRIWTAPRTRQEVRDNYQRELFGDENGLLAYWRTADGETLYGSIGSALTGDIENVGTVTDTAGGGTETATPTETESPTSTPADSGTSTPTDSPTVSPTDSPTASPTDSPTVSPTDSPTATPTDSPVPTTSGGTPTSTQTATSSPTAPGSQRGFFTNGGGGPLSFLNEVTLTMLGIVFSILGIIVEMLGLRGGN